MVNVILQKCVCVMSCVLHDELGVPNGRKSFLDGFRLHLWPELSVFVHYRVVKQRKRIRASVLVAGPQASGLNDVDFKEPN